MKANEETGSKKTGRLAMATIACLAAIFLAGALIGRAPWRRGHAADASRAAAPLVEGVEGRASSADAADPRQVDPRQQDRTPGAAAGAARLTGEQDAASSARGGGREATDRGWTSKRSSRASAAREERAPAAGAPGSLGAALPPSTGAGRGLGHGPGSGVERTSPSPVETRRPDAKLAAPAYAPAPPPSSFSDSQPAAPAARQEEPSPREETPPASDDPDSDRTAPVLESLGFEPPETRDGGSTNIVIRISDDLSGVRTVSGSLRSPSGSALLPFAAQGDSGGVFTGRVTIPPKAETGIWYVGNLIALDRANNSLIAGFTSATVPPGGTLRVTSAESDSTAPTVRAISVEKATVQGGERNLVRLEVDDEGSGVASVTGVFQSPTRAALIPFMCRLNADSASWDGDVTIPANADCGQWTLQSVRVGDNASNVMYLSSDSPLMAHAGFEVLGRDCDSTPPTLDSFSLTPGSISNETSGEILVTATVHDQGSGTIYVSGRVDGPIATNGQPPRIYFSCTRDPGNPDGPWTGKILVPQYTAKGTWRVGTVRVQDRALNARDYGRSDPVIASASFEVQ